MTAPAARFDPEVCRRLATWARELAHAPALTAATVALRVRMSAVAGQLDAAVAELEALTIARNADRSEWMTTYATMRAEIEALRCGDLGAFFDGELSPERADAFRLHLGTCSKCEAGLHGLMQERVVTEPTRKR